jgi:hypothetical protein
MNSTLLVTLVANRDEFVGDRNRYAQVLDNIDLFDEIDHILDEGDNSTYNPGGLGNLDTLPSGDTTRVCPFKTAICGIAAYITPHMLGFI